MKLRSETNHKHELYEYYDDIGNTYSYASGYSSFDRNYQGNKTY